MNRNLLNGVLAVALVALGVGVYFSQKKEEIKPPLTTLTAEKVQHILITHPDAKAIRLEKKAGQWMLTEPVQAAADKFEVNGVLALATMEQKKTLPLAGLNLADLGLAPPAYSIQLNDVKLELGGTEPLMYQRYIKVSGDAGVKPAGAFVALTDDPPSSALDTDYSDLVSKAVIPEGSEIEKIEVPGLSIAKGADGKWQATPASARATADAMQKFVQGWKEARSLWNQLDEKKGGSEFATITLKDRTLKFTLTSREPQLQLTRADIGVTFNLSKALDETLLKLPAPEAKAATPAGAPATSLDAIVPAAPDGSR